jgi:hypothetical protein
MLSKCSETIAETSRKGLEGGCKRGRSKASGGGWEEEGKAEDLVFHTKLESLDFNLWTLGSRWEIWDSKWCQGE